MWFFGTLGPYSKRCKHVAVGPIAAMLLVIGTAAATAQPADLVAAREDVLADRRLAAGYLRTGNVDLAALALERLAKALAGDATAGQASAALAAIDAGDPARAGVLVETMATALAAVRHAAGVRVFADCIRAASATYGTLDVYRNHPPNLGSPAVRTAIATAAQSTDAALARCDGEAVAPVKQDPDFRRLIDGARASLARLPAAADAGDADLVHRYLIELRAFEQLLLFRFG